MEGEDLALCVTCGTQYDTALDQPPSECHICEDSRQFKPPTGQQWTSLRAERGKHENKWTAIKGDEGITSIYAEPKLGIGQRAILIETDQGNVLWDCIAYISDELIEFINSKGGLKAIIISHPHFYTTHLTWSRAFSNCPIYLHSYDSQWLSRSDLSPNTRTFITSKTQEILPNITAIQCGGHFKGSMVLHWKNEKSGKQHLFNADTFINVPAALNPPRPKKGTNSYAFMWSIPNLIPLPPADVKAIWDAIKPFEFQATHGLMIGHDIDAPDVKGRVLESMQIQTRMMMGGGGKEEDEEKGGIFKEVWS